jgi:hypothetical protein
MKPVRKKRPPSKTLTDLYKQGEDKLLEWRGRKPEKPWNPEEREKPPRGRALYITTLGHLQVRQNPALRAWTNGCACHKDWRPRPVEKMTAEDLHRLCTTFRNDHPARKT